MTPSFPTRSSSDLLARSDRPEQARIEGTGAFEVVRSHGYIAQHRIPPLQRRRAPIHTGALRVFLYDESPQLLVVAAPSLHGPVWVLVICSTISISPCPFGTLPLVVIVTSVFLASIVPFIAMSTVWPLAVQVPATSILPPAT